MPYPVLLPGILLRAGQSIRVIENAVALTLSIVDPATGIALATDKVFHLRGNAATDDLVEVLRQTVQSHTGANTYTAAIARNIDGATLPSTVTVTRATGTNNFQIDWANAGTTVDPALWGYRTVATTNGTSCVGDISPTAQWVGNDVIEELEPESEVDAFVERARSGLVVGGLRGGPYDVARLSLRFQTAERTHERYAPLVSSVLDRGRAFSQCWGRLASGRRFELHLSTATGTALAALTTTSGGTRQAPPTQGTGWHLDSDSVEGGFRPERYGPGVPLYAWRLRLLGSTT